MSEHHDEVASLRPLSPVYLPDVPMKSALKKPRQSRRYKKQASMGEFKLNPIQVHLSVNQVLCYIAFNYA